MNANFMGRVVVGWILIIVGLAVIGQTINNSYKYFTGRADFPAVFTNLAANSVLDSKITAAADSQNLQEMAQAQIQQSMNQAIGNILPADSITKLLNIIVWSIFATFLVYAGAKIASLGIQLLSLKNC